MEWRLEVPHAMPAVKEFAKVLLESMKNFLSVRLQLVAERMKKAKTDLVEVAEEYQQIAAGIDMVLVGRMI